MSDVETARVCRVLKCDALGRIEELALASGSERAVRRVACGGRIPGSALVARVLLARERRALRAIAGMPGVPALHALDASASARELVRTWIVGVGLHEADALPADFFDHLDVLVAALHARGVCHNDLHKEQNILVDPRGFPWLVDFQLASVHKTHTRLFASRVRDDLRHVEKHRRRYARAGGPRIELPAEARGRGHGIRRSWTAWIWRRSVKPLYIALTRGVLRTRDGEARRATSGPWPRRTEALGRPDWRA
ncbi:MAG: hypothetical protein ACKVWV_12840 [Planctomycetota bacterium]